MFSEKRYDQYHEKSETTYIIGLTLWFVFCCAVTIGIWLSAIMYQLSVSLGQIFCWDFLSHPIVISDVLWVALYTAILGAIARFVLKRFVAPIVVNLIV